MLSIPTRTSVVLAALVALASVSVSSLPAASMPVWGAPAQRKDDKDKKPAEGLTAAQRQEVSPLAKLADEVMKGAAPGTYLVTPPKDPSAKDAKDAKDTPSQPAPEVAITLRTDFLKAQQGLIRALHRQPRARQDDLVGGGLPAHRAEGRDRAAGGYRR